ncbi:hypothetical protein SDC9_194956 [bioreactor metagenome]|uniref:Uncharacterized protein n=1 Tax=bioreactor metagenome TaxID=1076179 RepID=A0A645IGC4_9ZZZZ
MKRIFKLTKVTYSADSIHQIHEPLGVDESSVKRKGKIKHLFKIYDFENFINRFWFYPRSHKVSGKSSHGCGVILLRKKAFFHQRLQKSHRFEYISGSPCYGQTIALCER